MVVTHCRGFGGEVFFSLSHRPLRRNGRLPACRKTGASLTRFGNVFFFGELLCVAMLAGFGEQRCRKNLLLGARD